MAVPAIITTQNACFSAVGKAAIRPLLAIAENEAVDKKNYYANGDLTV